MLNHYIPETNIILYTNYNWKKGFKLCFFKFGIQILFFKNPANCEEDNPTKKWIKDMKKSLREEEGNKWCLTISVMGMWKRREINKYICRVRYVHDLSKYWWEYREKMSHVLLLGMLICIFISESSLAKFLIWRWTSSST